MDTTTRRYSSKLIESENRCGEIFENNDPKGLKNGFSPSTLTQCNEADDRCYSHLLQLCSWLQAIGCMRKCPTSKSYFEGGKR